MTLSLQNTKLLPPCILIYGEPKKGKSTMGFQAPNSVFIQTEDGLAGMPEAKAFPLAAKFSDVIGAMAELHNEEHNFNTLVVDSLDWLEVLIHAEVCAQKRVASIAEVAYGAGYNAALAYWREYIDAVNQLRANRQMMVVQIAHSHIADYKTPDSEAYSKHCIKLHKSAAAYLKERADMIIFVNSFVATKTVDGKNGRKLAIGGDERMLYMHDKANNEAGTRYHNMPAEIPFDKEGKYWNTIMSSIPFFNQNNQ